MPHRLPPSTAIAQSTAARVGRRRPSASRPRRPRPRRHPDNAGRQARCRAKSCDRGVGAGAAGRVGRWLHPAAPREGRRGCAAAPDRRSPVIAASASCPPCLSGDGRNRPPDDRRPVAASHRAGHGISAAVAASSRRGLRRRRRGPRAAVQGAGPSGARRHPAAAVRGVNLRVRRRRGDHGPRPLHRGPAHRAAEDGRAHPPAGRRAALLPLRRPGRDGAVRAAGRGAGATRPHAPRRAIQTRAPITSAAPAACAGATVSPRKAAAAETPKTGVSARKSPASAAG